MNDSLCAIELYGKLEAVGNYEKKQLDSFYFIPGAQPCLGTRLLVFYCPCDLKIFRKTIVG